LTAKRVAAIGVFSALAYVGSFVLMSIPNATLAILLIFYAGYYLGVTGGALTGMISALLISLFNPYGLAMLPILAAQVLAYVIIGGLGGLFADHLTFKDYRKGIIPLSLLGLLTALTYQVPVSLMDAWLFGPFWARLTMSIGFALVTIVSNILFFALLFPLLAKLKKVGIFRLN
jgi:uncharacterized membrane protein